jgi:hypothetical protein
MKIKLEFEVEDLKGFNLLIERNGEYIEAEIEDIRKGRVKISPDDVSMKDYWVEKAQLVVVDILPFQD